MGACCSPQQRTRKSESCSPRGCTMVAQGTLFRAEASSLLSAAYTSFAPRSAPAIATSISAISPSAFCGIGKEQVSACWDSRPCCQHAQPGADGIRRAPGRTTRLRKGQNEEQRQNTSRAMVMKSCCPAIHIPWRCPSSPARAARSSEAMFCPASRNLSSRNLRNRFWSPKLWSRRRPKKNVLSSGWPWVCG